MQERQRMQMQQGARVQREAGLVWWWSVGKREKARRGRRGAWRRPHVMPAHMTRVVLRGPRPIGQDRGLSALRCTLHLVVFVCLSVCLLLLRLAGRLDPARNLSPWHPSCRLHRPGRLGSRPGPGIWRGWRGEEQGHVALVASEQTRRPANAAGLHTTASAMTAAAISNANMHPGLHHAGAGPAHRT